MKKADKILGFTLVELVITLAIAVILAVIAVPMFRSMIQNSRIATQVNQFVGDLNYARNEAIKRGVSIHVTALNNTDNANEWGSGWRIWIDSNTNGQFDNPIDDEVLREYQSQVVEMTLDSVTDNLTQLGFLPGGAVAVDLFQPAKNSDWPTNFQLRIPDCSGKQGRNIALERSGAMHTTAVECQ